MPAAGRERPRTSLSILEKVIEMWALAGGIVLVAIVLLTAYSLASGILLNAPLPGDFELVEVGVAVAVFAFLPYCQLTDANVSADIFTARASPRTVSALTFVGSVLAFVVGCVLLWRMYLGMLDAREYGEVTTVNAFPIWIAFVPILVSLALLIAASLITMLRSWKGESLDGGPGLTAE